MTERIKNLFFLPTPALAIAYVRICLYLFFVYKLLSRDFSTFGLYTNEMLQIYPYQTFSPLSGYVSLSFPAVVHAATFHWIHWIVPLPTESALWLIQFLAICSCTLVLLFGKGPRNIFAISSFVLLQYLWGFCWRSGAEVDSMFIQLQLALIFCFLREKEALVLFRPAPVGEITRANGAFYSLILLVFITYYFYSGINKLVDIPISDWFAYNLRYEVAEAVYAERFGYFTRAAPFSSALLDQEAINWGVPFTYFMELTIPLMFFYRRLVLVYLGFFVFFHLMTWTVGILFFGNMLIWLALLPVHKLLPNSYLKREEDWGEFSTVSRSG